MDIASDVSIVGICGMAGVGKTIIAKSVYNSNCDKFEGSCFLPNIREVAITPNGLVVLQRQLLSSIGKRKENKLYDVDEGIMRIRYVVRNRRVLIVLDDVDHMDQLHALIGNLEWYLPGSKIIITTRQKQLLHRYHGDDGYHGDEVLEVETLDEEESLKLFSFHAFGQDYPPAGYRDHSRRLAEQCGGLPLALVVLGSSLCGQSLSRFEIEIEKMKVIPHSIILDSLKTSFDSLAEHDRHLFLHIACLFVGKDKDYVSKILDGCDFITTIGIQDLIDGSLLSIDLDNKLRMHQLLQDMGREIVRQESPREPGRFSIVWCHKDAVDVVTKGTGTEAIEGLILDFHVSGGDKPVETRDSKGLFSWHPMSAVVKSFSTSDKNVLQTDAFSRMYRLRLLQLNNVHLMGDYAEFPRGLVWLCWRGIPLKSLPAGFPVENLVVLDLRYSSLKQVWKKTKFLPRLRILNLSHSHGLTRCPDFKALPNLERLVLKDCINLIEVHDSIMGLRRLRLLNLKGCIKLRKLPRQIHQLESLEKLDLSCCSNLDKVPEKLIEGSFTAQIRRMLILLVMFYILMWFSSKLEHQIIYVKNT